jgi:phage terminase large subunit-like protein
MSEVNYDDYLGLIQFKPTLVGDALERVTANVVALFTGNQFGKNRTMADYLYKCVYGLLPIERYNMRPSTKCRIIRLCAATLPQPNESKDGASEVKNTIYPVVKSVFPKNIIKKDITARSQVMTLHDPQGGDDVQLEFTSYNQDTNEVAGVQRFLIWCDEKPPFNFWDEQKPRTLATGGRTIITLTSIEANWTFEEIFERARLIIRTPIVQQAYKTYLNKDVPLVEKTDNVEDIVVIQAATDDNPIWPDTIKMLNLNMTVDEYIRTKLNFDDPDTLLMRRYGINKQISGAIFKDFQWDIHVISGDKYFVNGIPHNWRIARLCDYHEGNPWAVPWVALSPQNECFVWKEREYSPDKWTTLEVARDISSKTGDYKSHLDLADPRMEIMQPSVGTSVLKDMNRIFQELKG